MSRESLRRVARVVALAAALGCREGSENRSGEFLPAVPGEAGTQGCRTADAPAIATPIFTSSSFGPLSQIAAAATGGATDVLYWTGTDGVHELAIDPGGGVMGDALLLAAAEIEDEYLMPAGIAAPAELSGIAVVDAAFLVVAEHASNTLVVVDRIPPIGVRNLAGRRDAAGGFDSGSGNAVTFRFDASVPLFFDAAGLLYVGDTGNHALRQVAVGGISSVSTIAGSGAPGEGVGPLEVVQFDTPSGFAASCAGELLVVESGAAGMGGQLLKSLRLPAPFFFFGSSGGSALVLAGDGTSATTEGRDTAAQLAMPMGLASSDDGRVLWLDAASAILRRYDFATGISDCPMFADCATAVAGPSPFVGESFSMALGESGAVYVLGTSATGGTLWRVHP